MIPNSLVTFVLLTYLSVRVNKVGTSILLGSHLVSHQVTKKSTATSNAQSDGYQFPLA